MLRTYIIYCLKMFVANERVKLFFFFIFIWHVVVNNKIKSIVKVNIKKK